MFLDIDINPCYNIFIYNYYVQQLCGSPIFPPSYILVHLVCMCICLGHGRELGTDWARTRHEHEHGQDWARARAQAGLGMGTGTGGTGHGTRHGLGMGTGGLGMGGHMWDGNVITSNPNCYTCFIIYNVHVNMLI